MTGSLQAIILQLRDDIFTNRANLEKKIEEQTAVITALQKGIGVNTNLNEKFMTDMAAYLGSNEQLKTEVECLRRKLTEAEINVASNQKVENELASFKRQCDSVVTELQKEIKVNTSYTEKYKSDLADSREQNQQLKIEIERLGRKLVEAETNVASKQKVEDELISFKSKIDCIVAELQKEINVNTNYIEKYKSDLAASLEENDQLKHEVLSLCKKLSEADIKIASNEVELQKGIDENTSLNEKYKSDLATSREQHQQLKIEIERLGRKLVEAQTNIALKQKVEDELVSLN